MVAECARTDGASAPSSPEGSTVSVRVARGLVEVAETHGVPRAELLHAAELEPQILERDDARILLAELSRLCELAVERTGDPALALHWAERYSDSTFTPIAHLMAHAASLRDAFELLTKYYPLLTDERRFDLLEEGAHVVVRFAGRPGETPVMRRFTAEMFTAGLLRVIRSFATAARPERVCFNYPEPGYRAEYTRVFDGAEHFDQPFTGIVFDRAWMSAASLHKDEDVEGALRSIAEQRVLRLTQQAPFKLRVRELLLKQPAHGADMDAVAQRLGLSVRSLRRKLAAEGESYEAIANEARATIAKQLLRDRGLSIQDAAFEMGFADANSFHRAFKRWTGTTPGAYRQRG